MRVYIVRSMTSQLVAVLS